MKLTIWIIAAIAVALLLVGVTAQAMPKSSYFLQDDFIMTFGQTGDMLAAGTEMSGSGRLLDWDKNKLVGWFAFDAKVTYAGQASNGEWMLTFDDGTFNITKPTGGTTLWAGTIDHFTIKGYTDPSTRFAAANYLRPIYENQPTEFISVGGAKFIRTAGAWTDPTLLLDWIGAYNLNLDADTPAESTNIFGNLQARLVVPEPAGIVAMICGLVGLVGFGVKKRA